MSRPYLSTDGRTLLRESVRKHRPECLSAVDGLNGSQLTETEREELRDAVVAELVTTGLDPDDEPNRRGQELERLIDLLGRL